MGKRIVYNRFLNMFKEGEDYSLTRVLIAFGYLVFIAVSLYLAFTGKGWANYGEFCIATGGNVLAQLGNKFINSKYNTPMGSCGKTAGGL